MYNRLRHTSVKFLRLFLTARHKAQNSILLDPPRTGSKFLGLLASMHTDYPFLMSTPFIPVPVSVFTETVLVDQIH
jgi:hypothetical protein